MLHRNWKHQSCIAEIEVLRTLPGSRALDLTVNHNADFGMFVMLILQPTFWRRDEMFQSFQIHPLGNCRQETVTGNLFLHFCVLSAFPSRPPHPLHSQLQMAIVQCGSFGLGGSFAVFSSVAILVP